MGNPTSPAVAAPLTCASGRRPRCQHGEKCYRKNPEHLAQFCHPCDADWEAPQESAKAGYTVSEAPVAVCAAEDGSLEDKGLMGAAGGAAAVLGAGALAHHAGGLEWAHDRPGMALLGGAAALAAGALAGHKLEDHMTGKHSEPAPSCGGLRPGHSHPSRPSCKYFAAGYCKDGSRCRYSHGTAGSGARGRRLVVRVKNASGLRNTDGPFAGKSDPYVILRLVDQNGKTVAGPSQTSVKDDTLNPIWNEDIIFEGLDTPAAYTLKMNVFDKDTFLGTGHLDWLSSDDKLGDGTVDLGTLYKSSGFQDREIVIERRKLGFFKAKLNIALSTGGQWGN